MGEFHNDLDYLFEINVREESNFQDLVSDHLAEWPDVSRSEAVARLSAKVVQLLDSGKIRIYSEQWATPESRTDLTLPEAKAAAQDSGNWKASDEIEWFHCIYASET